MAVNKNITEAGRVGQFSKSKGKTYAKAGETFISYW